MRERRLKLRRVDGELNLADHLTKPKSINEMKEKIKDAGGELKERNIEKVAYCTERVQTR